MSGGYLANLGVFAVIYGLGVPYIPASIVSYFIANALMYFGNRYFTFGPVTTASGLRTVRCMVVGAVVVALNAGILAALVAGTGIDPRLGQAISLLLITPVAFVLVQALDVPDQAGVAASPRASANIAR